MASYLTSSYHKHLCHFCPYLQLASIQSYHKVSHSEVVLNVLDSSLKHHKHAKTISNRSINKKQTMCKPVKRPSLFHLICIHIVLRHPQFMIATLHNLNIPLQNTKIMMSASVPIYVFHDMLT